MTMPERWSLHASALAVGGTGLAYGWLKYFHQRAGEFGAEPWPAQGWSQHAHVLTAPVLVFTLGLLVRGHVLPAVRAGGTAGRRSGLLMAAILAPMILSGYAIQVCLEPGARAAMAWVHGPFSLLFLVAYGVHLARG